MSGYTNDKYEAPAQGVSVIGSRAERFFIAQSRQTGSWTVFGPNEDGKIMGCETFRDALSALEMAASWAVRRTAFLAGVKCPDLF
jgi:uncharacterized protein YmfQ (DUF2313 family)